jgi:hypothetical protein
MSAHSLPAFDQLSANLFTDETELVYQLASKAKLDGSDAHKTQELATNLVKRGSQGAQAEGRR